MALACASLQAGSAVEDISRKLEADLYALVLRARDSGAPDGAIVEHRILRAFQLNDLDALLGLVPQLESVSIPFGEGHFLKNEKDRDGFVAALMARFYNELNDESAFFDAAGTARLLSPEWFRQLEVDELSKEFKLRQGGQIISMDLALGKMGGGSVRLGELLAGHCGLLLDFWASWCGPCMRAMPTLKQRGADWRPQGLAMAGVNTDHDDQERHATTTFERYQMDLPWLLEPASRPLSERLEIDSIPRVILLDPSGKVIFNGHPEDAQLKTALRELGITP